MNLDNVLVVSKESKLEYDCRRNFLRAEDMIQRYRNMRVSVDNVLKSHESQVKARDHFRSIFKQSNFIFHTQLTQDLADSAELIVAIGGDDTLKRISHFVDDNLIVGVNSDPSRSVGALLNYSFEEAEKLYALLESDSYKVDNWTRIDVNYNGSFLGKAASELFIGARESDFPSRLTVDFPNRTLDLKGSGLLVATGAGASGWYKSAGGLWQSDRTSPKLAWINREPSIRLYEDVNPDNTDVLSSGQIVVYYTGNHEGKISIDSIMTKYLNPDEDHSFVIKKSEHPLRVISK
jgi:hypothetical protein